MLFTRASNASNCTGCIFRIVEDLIFISRTVVDGSSIPDATLKAEREQPVVANGFLEGT
jgi:hypothetical protein